MERLTYDTLGETHQQTETLKKTVIFKDINEKLEQCHNIMTSDVCEHDDVNYNGDKAHIIARIMVQIYEQAALHGMQFVQQHAQQYVFEKGLKIFGERGEKAAHDELDQLHRRMCFSPLSVGKLTADEKQKAQYAIMLLTEKRIKQ